MSDKNVDKKRKKDQSGSGPQVEPSGGSRGRNWTVSLAVPGSIVGSLERIDAAAAVAGTIARAAVSGRFDEVVVYDDNEQGDGSAFLSMALQFLETPPYLRTLLCPMDAAWASALQHLGPIGAPHHLNQTDWMPYREGVVLKSSASAGEGQHGNSFIDIGLDRMAYVPVHLPESARVTAFLGDAPTTKFVPEFSETMIVAEVVAAITPRVKHDLYTGFMVRPASSLHEVIKGCPFRAGYDLTIGTSGRGIERGHADLVLPRYSHALLLFGGANKGLEEIMKQEEPLQSKNPEDYFNLYLNVCINQGSKSIRTEDAVLIALGYLRPALLKFGGDTS